MIVILYLCLLIIIFFFIERKSSKSGYTYKNSEYFQITHLPFLNLRADKGKFGEYMIYKSLYSLPGYKKFLFNVYVPKNDETTEIDILLLHETGLYVFESKNYDGWIFGKEEQYKWTQVLLTGNKSSKFYFYNPIKQNKTHVKYLKKYLSNYNLVIFPYIVFNNQCRLKDINVNKDTKVLYRKEILSDIKQNTVKMYTPEIIDEIYLKLYPLTQDQTIKEQHVKNIQKHINDKF